MSSITIKDGSTTATTGGTDQVFDRTNTSVNNGYEYADTSEADFFAREKIILSSRMPQLQSDGLHSKKKASARFIQPVTRTDGSTGYNVSRYETEYYPESSVAEIAELREKGAQMAIGATFDDLHKVGTLP